MRGEMEEGSPVLAAPGSKSSRQSTAIINGTTDEEIQSLSDEQIELVNNYRFFAYSLTKDHHNKGKTREELRAGAEDGLLDAALRFDPSLGFPFSAHARPWITGGIKAIFKKRAIDQCTTELAALPPSSIDGQTFAAIDAALPPIDLGILEGRQRQVIEARLAGKTLEETGAELGISTERVRQIESRATEKLRDPDTPVYCVCGNERREMRFADRDARKFREEYLAFAKLGIKGPKAPTHHFLPPGVGKSVKKEEQEEYSFRGFCEPKGLSFPKSPKHHRYPGGRTYTPDEIAAFVAKRPDLEG
jgi:RNA polymerase sigma factor (sigma-70 family)